MENKMFCYQCQETAGFKGCTMVGVCGKQPDVAAMQDLLVYVSKGISAVTTALRKEGKPVAAEINHLITLNLFTTITNANFDKESIEARIRATLDTKKELLAQLSDPANLPEAAKWDGSGDWEEKAKTVGVLYCSAESNSKIQADMAKEAIAAAGMESKEYTVSSSNEIQTVVQSMVGAVDAVYAPTDNVIAAGMATVGMVAGDNNLPVICGEAGMVQNGGLATYGIDYYQLGYMTGQQAVKILTEGASPADMPIEYLPAEKCELTVNEETAQTLGIDVSGLK